VNGRVRVRECGQEEGRGRFREGSGKDGEKKREEAEIDKAVCVCVYIDRGGDEKAWKHADSSEKVG